MTFDVYASSFVPQWLRDIHEAPAQHVYATAPTDFEIQFDQYTSTFAGTSLLGDGHLYLEDQPGKSNEPYSVVSLIQCPSRFIFYNLRSTSTNFWQSQETIMLEIHP